MGGVRLITEQLIERAKTCNSCRCWVDVCKAECCRGFSLSKELLPDKPWGKSLKVRLNLSFDVARYFKLHGCKWVRGALIIKPALYDKIVLTDKQYHFHRKCDYLLDDLLCKGHSNGLKPEICKEFKETSLNNPGHSIMPKCLARYKNLEATIKSNI